MKILFILPEFYPHSGGGIATFYEELLKGYLEQQHEVTIIVGSGLLTADANLVWNGIQIHPLTYDRLFQYKNYFNKFLPFPVLRLHLAAAWAMFDMAKEIGQFDLVECTDWGWGFIPWLITNTHKIVVQFHASIGEIFKYDPIPGKELEAAISQTIELTTLSSCNLLIAHSKSTREWWHSQLKCKVHYQLPPFDQQAYKNKFVSSGDNQQFVLVAGRVQFWKGAITLCEAFKILNKNAPSTIWLGRSTEYKNENMSEYLGREYPSIWQKKIINPGQVDKAEIGKFQLQARYVIIPSVWDVFNYTCLEAMSLGKIVICSNGAGASDLISDGFNGFVFNKNDAADLAKVILKVESLTPEEKEEIEKNAISTIADRCCPQKLVQERIRLYSEINANPINPSDWVKEFISPSNSDNNFNNLLDNIPLKTLISHTTKRVWEKIKK